MTNSLPARPPTHGSTTDPEARLARKGPGREAKLCFAGHVLMESKRGLAVDVVLTQATGTAERDAALEHYDTDEFVAPAGPWV